MNYFAIFLSIYSFFQWDNLREFLAKKWVIGISASAGTSVIGWMAVINPILQFVGLCLGIFIGILTAKAKIEEMKMKRGTYKPDVHPELKQKIDEKKHNAIKQRNENSEKSH